MSECPSVRTRRILYQQQTAAGVRSSRFTYLCKSVNDFRPSNFSKIVYVIHHCYLGQIGFKIAIFDIILTPNCYTPAFTPQLLHPSSYTNISYTPSLTPQLLHPTSYTSALTPHILDLYPTSYTQSFTPHLSRSHLAVSPKPPTPTLLPPLLLHSRDLIHHLLQNNTIK